jgi:DNA-binding protein H-NS
MSKLSIASQLAAIQKQKDTLAKKEAALKTQSHGIVLTKIIKMASEAGLSLAEITAAYKGHQQKAKSKPKAKSTKSGLSKTNNMKGVKLSPKYRNPQNPNQTWTGRGIDPGWVAKLRETGILESALIQKL